MAVDRRTAGYGHLSFCCCIISGEQTLPQMILHLFPKRPGQTDCALALDETHNRRHGILQRTRNHHVHKLDKQMMENSLAITAQPFRAKERRNAGSIVPDQD